MLPAYTPIFSKPSKLKLIKFFSFIFGRTEKNVCGKYLNGVSIFISFRYKCRFLKEIIYSQNSYIDTIL